MRQDMLAQLTEDCEILETFRERIERATSIINRDHVDDFASRASHHHQELMYEISGVLIESMLERAE